MSLSFERFHCHKRHETLPRKFITKRRYCVKNSQLSEVCSLKGLSDELISKLIEDSFNLGKQNTICRVKQTEQQDHRLKAEMNNKD